MKELILNVQITGLMSGRNDHTENITRLSSGTIVECGFANNGCYYIKTQ